MTQPIIQEWWNTEHLHDATERNNTVSFTFHYDCMVNARIRITSKPTSFTPMWLQVAWDFISSRIQNLKNESLLWIKSQQLCTMRAFSIIHTTTVKNKDNERMCLPVHGNNAGSYTMFYGRPSWAGIQGHCFITHGQKQDDRDNGSFFFKPLTTKYRQDTQETSILPKALLFLQSARLLFHDHWWFIYLIQGDSYYHPIHSPID